MIICPKCNGNRFITSIPATVSVIIDENENIVQFDKDGVDFDCIFCSDSCTCIECDEEIYFEE